jgi:hypothetical protein
MADIVLTIDPDDTSFALHDRANGRRLMGFDAPVPETDSQWAFSADTEGERRANLRYRNRVITAQVLLDKSTAALLEAVENTLGQKVGKLAREGGELRFTYPTGTTITFNVLEATMNRVFDIADMAKFRARYEISFICEPFGLGTEVDMGDNTETTLPVLIFTETGILGDVSGLGRLVIDNDVAVDQWWLTWGIESRNYSSSANAALFYEAEGRTTLGVATTASAITGSSGSSYAVLTVMTPDYTAMLSTQATGGGAHLSHIGTFRVYARVQVPSGNTGDVTIALEWSEGDFLNVTRNAPTDLSGADRWRYVDLGLVSPKAVVSGTQRWEGRVIVKSAGLDNVIAVDYLLLVPADEGSGVVAAVAQDATPTTFSARDNFTGTTSGNALNARTPVTGAAWATSGAATDFVFIDALAAGGNAGEAVSRSINTSSARYAVLGSNMTAMKVTCQFGIEDGATHLTFPTLGLLARWVDSSNHLIFDAGPGQTGGGPWVLSPRIRKVVSGVSTTIAGSGDEAGVWVAANSYVTLSLTVYANGKAVGRIYTASGALAYQTSASDTTLATGGTLASGKPGIIDRSDGTNTVERWYDEIQASVPSTDAAVFASQSLEVRHNLIVREDSGGTLWVKPSSYAGDYLLVPPAGAEARTARVVVKMTRDDATVSDGSIDDLSARLFYTPRFLVVPDA